MNSHSVNVLSLTAARGFCPTGDVAILFNGVSRLRNVSFRLILIFVRFWAATFDLQCAATAHGRLAPGKRHLDSMFTEESLDAIVDVALDLRMPPRAIRPDEQAEIERGFAEAEKLYARLRFCEDMIDAFSRAQKRLSYRFDT